MLSSIQWLDVTENYLFSSISSIKYAWYVPPPSQNSRGSLTTAPVGLTGGIRWLPGYLHCHSQFLSHCAKPSDLHECDILPSSVAGQRLSQWRCPFPIWVDPTGTLVGNHVHPCDEWAFPFRVAGGSVPIFKYRQRMAQDRIH